MRENLIRFVLGQRKLPPNKRRMNFHTGERRGRRVREISMRVQVCTRKEDVPGRPTFIGSCCKYRASSHDPYSAAAKAIRMCLDEPYPYWRTRDSGERAGWFGPRMERRDPVKSHRLYIENEP